MPVLGVFPPEVGAGAGAVVDVTAGGTEMEVVGTGKIDVSKVVGT